MTAADDLRRLIGELDPAAKVTLAVYAGILVAIALEALVALDRIVDPRRAARRGLSLLVTVGGAIVASLPMTAAIAGLWVVLGRLAPAPVVDWWAEHRAVELVVCFLAWDLAAYGYHRVGHRTRVGWASHRVHHLGQTYDMSLVLRQPWFPVHGLVVLPWLALAGFSFEAAAVSSVLSIGYQALQHTTIEWRWPAPLEAVLVSGRAHRHHHLVDGGGVNLGAVLTVWDRLFGTRRAGLVGESPRFGVGSPEPLNPLRNQVEGWRGLLRPTPAVLARSAGALTATCYNLAMPTTSRPGSCRSTRSFRWCVALVVAVALVGGACSSDDSSSDDSSSADGPALPAAAQEIIDRPAYAVGSWSWSVVDQGSGEVLYANQQDSVNLLASTTKLFTTGTYLDQVGPDDTLETPVYSSGTRSGSELRGELVLVGSGDFVMGSRGVLGGGDLQFQSPDHIYFYASPTVQRVEGDPLAGLDDLAAQVKASGISSVTGDVLVDDRLWDAYDSKEGVVTPIMVNDNLLDIAVTPGAAAGDATTVDLRPVTSYFEVVNQVTTSAADVPTDLGATVDGNRVVVAGTVPAGAAVQNTGVFAPDPAAYARALFIEALGRAGVTVTAPVAAAAPLPAEGWYQADAKVASLASPPASVLAKLVLKTSHNRGAESLMCLLAVKAGSTNCEDGLTTMLTTVGTAGVDQSSVFLFDGEGTDPASATPTAVIGWLTWAAKQSWGEGYRLSMPDVVNDGSIMVKSGTSAAPQNPPMPSMFMVQGEAGYMTTASGRQVVVAVYARNGTYPTVAQGLAESGPAVTEWLAAVKAAN